MDLNVKYILEIVFNLSIFENPTWWGEVGREYIIYINMIEKKSSDKIVFTQASHSMNPHPKM